MKLEENKDYIHTINSLSKKKKKFAEEHANSRASVAISMRDERIFQGCDSVTDSANYMERCDVSSNDSKNNYHQTKK